MLKITAMEAVNVGVGIGFKARSTSKMIMVGDVLETNGNKELEGGC